MNTENNPTIQFAIEKLRRDLKQNPDKAVELAVNYFEDWLVLSSEHQQLYREHQRLERKYQAVMNECQLLTSQLIDTQVTTTTTLPPFLDCHRH